MRLARSKRGLGFRSSGRSALVGLAAVMISSGVSLPVLAQVVNSPKQSVVPASSKLEGEASWYKVPRNSVTRQRAGKDELTAAHNRLPFGTLVRVTDLENEKSVIVRITDRLISTNGTIIDLSQEAAAQLEIVREGTVRVRLEILTDDDKVPPYKMTPWSW
jgi:rare lipoprotein A